MPAHIDMHGYDDDDDAPEEVGLAQAKRAVKGSAGAVRAFAESERGKRKARNRTRDAALKSRAGATTANTVEEEPEFAGVDADSGDELDQDGSGSEEEAAAAGSSADDDGSGDDEDGSDDDEDGSEDSVDDDADADSVDDLDELSPVHLPDHLFAALARPTTPPSALPSKRPASSSSRPLKRRRTTPKDVVVGNRTLRTLGTPLQAAAARTIPPAKLARFASTHLGLTKDAPSKERWKAKKAKTKPAYERRAANVGVAKSSGPAARFARG